MIKKIFIPSVVLILAFSAKVMYLKNNLEKTEAKFERMDEDSGISIPKNYNELVLKDKENEMSFLLNKTNYSELIKREFPYNKRRLNNKTTNDILKILNDTSSYIWGELGTPYYDYCIKYYNSEDEVIGISKVDLGGAVISHPYRNLMKWGTLSIKGDELFVKTLFRK